MEHSVKRQNLARDASHFKELIEVWMTAWFKIEIKSQSH
jgi:hypothetical protein